MLVARLGARDRPPGPDTNRGLTQDWTSKAAEMKFCDNAERFIYPSNFDGLGARSILSSAQTAYTTPLSSLSAYLSESESMEHITGPFYQPYAAQFALRSSTSRDDFNHILM